MLDFEECDRARIRRDAAYDGRFFTGVHQALGWRTPDEAYLGQLTPAPALAA